MKEGRPSTTAWWVAALRGLASSTEGAIIADPVAERLIPAPYDRILAFARRHPRFMTALHALADEATRGRSRHLPLRTRAIDDAVIAAVSRGVRQLVLLGAGLDARPWRLEALRDVTVFEVDHPIMQAYKRPRVEALPPRAREVRFVASDFERDDVSAHLAAAGHDATLESVFVWEAVTMYLSREAIDRTLTGVAARCAPASTLLITYFLPVDRSGLDARVLQALLERVGEPVTTELLPADIARVLFEHGFDVTADEGDPEWSQRYLGRPQPWTLERLVHASRRG